MTPVETRHAIGEWRLARTLLPIYAELAPPDLPPPCPASDLHEARSDAALRQVLDWFGAVDERLKPQEFRSRLRAAAGADLGAALELVLERLLTAPAATAEQVQKVDEACFDYFCLYAPPSFHARRVAREDVAAVLEPALKHAPLGGGLPRGMDALLARLEALPTLPQLAASDVLPQARALRLADAAGCCERGALIAFTHFNYVAHVTRTRLARADAEYILAAEAELRARQVVALDCAGVGAEPREQLLARMRALLAGSEAVSGQNLRLIAAARLATEKLLGADTVQRVPAAPPVERAALPAAVTVSAMETAAEAAPAPLTMPLAEEQPAVPAAPAPVAALPAVPAEAPPAAPHMVFAYDVVDEFCARTYPFTRSHKAPRRRTEDLFVVEPGPQR